MEGAFCIFLSAGYNFVFMLVELIAVSFAASSVFLSVLLLVRRRRFRETTDVCSGLAPAVLSAEALLVISDMCVGDGCAGRLMCDIELGMLGMMFFVSSIWSDVYEKRVVPVVLSAMCLMTLWYIMAAFDAVVPPGQFVCLGLSVVVVSVLVLLYVCGLWSRIRSVKTVMKSGTVWSWLSLAVDSIYVVLMLVYVAAFLFCTAAGVCGNFPVALILLLSACLVLALGVRVSLDSAFVFLHRHERRIVESMKITQVETAMDASRVEGHNRELYERIQQYFEDERPYLRGDLTINDIVKAVYTNKLYISRAISQCTGRNFCQYVNYYRVTHSVNAFRDNPELKIHELANASGFNSVVSFNMAFRLYMGENPSDWCRKEKKRLARRVK